MTEPAESPEQGADKIAQWDREVVNALMSTPQGRFWMDRLLEYCGAGRPVYFDDGDALGMAKRDGRADVGRFLQGQLEDFCPDMFLRMVRDRRSRIARAKAEIEKQRQATEGEPASAALTPIDEMADEQARLAAEEAERAATKPKKKDR